MELLLGLMMKVSRDYGFSAFVLALLMILFYWMVTNKKLIDVADRVLNGSLTSTNLYKFIKLGVVLVFVFSCLVVTLSFLTPMIVKSFENQSLELILQGRQAFKARDYGHARESLQKSLALMSPDEPNADEIRGLITATYYVNELHEQGLRFICSQYKYKPAADRSYLYAVHAHLRKLAVNQGAEAAESLANLLRKQCARADFSRFWAHIPFGMMESLRMSRLRSEHGWEVKEQSKIRLRYLIASEQEIGVSRQVAFGDYALYFLGEFDRLLADYPQSNIRDMALFDAAMFADKPRRIAYLAALIETQPKSPRFDDAVIKIAELLSALGQREKALSYVALIKSNSAIDRASLAALRPTFDAFDTFIRQGDLASAKALATAACNEFVQKRLPCNATLEQELQRASKAIKISAASYQKLHCSTAQGKLRELSVLDDKSIDPKWFLASRQFLVSCLDSAKDDPEDYARSLYLIASLSRRGGDYKTSLYYLQRFDREISEHDLLDDVVTEIGYHKFVIERDWAAARPYFERVIKEFPTRNAWDNALWWYAKGCTQDGEYAEAILAYAQIASSATSRRLINWSGIEQASLERLIRLGPFIGVSLKPRGADEGGIGVSLISPDSPAASILMTGDRLIRVCGYNIYDIRDVLGAIAEIGKGPACDVMYLRGKKLIRFSRSGDAEWRAQAIDLNSEQLTKLVFGAPIR